MAEQLLNWHSRFTSRHVLTGQEFHYRFLNGRCAWFRGDGHKGVERLRGDGDDCQVGEGVGQVRLVQFRHAKRANGARTQVGILIDEVIYCIEDIESGASDLVRLAREGGLDALLPFWDSVQGGLQRLAEAVDRGDHQDAAIGLDDVAFLPPVVRPGKILCVASNYASHISEGTTIDLRPKAVTTPWFFLKPTTSLIGHNDPVKLPSWSDQVDWEVELAVVIGRRGHQIDAPNALDYVAGYTIFNDISARSIKTLATRDSRDWDKFFDWMYGKWSDTFAPMGPSLVTRDEIASPNDVSLYLRLNGMTYQDSSTSEMIYSVEELIAFVSRIVTLEPGDVIATGTPAGVGKSTGTFLKPGDVMLAAIEGLGVLRTPVAEALL